MTLGRCPLSITVAFDDSKKAADVFDGLLCCLLEGLGFGGWGFGLRVKGAGLKVLGLGFEVYGLGFRVQGPEFRVQGFVFRD